MSYIGLNPNEPLLNTSTQFESGNGFVSQYTLNRAVASASDLDVIVGNVPQVPFVDYEAGNTSIIFVTAPPLGDQNVAITYRGGALNTLDLTATVFGAGTIGNPSVYSVAANNTGLYWPSPGTLAVTVSGANRALFNANAVSVNTTTGGITTVGGIGAGGNLNVGNNIVIYGTTESSSVTTGSLRVGGGTGIVGNLNVGGDITCVGDFTVNGTFTTTGTDSLEVTDPFIFLANANPGDTYDTGVVSQYFDGSVNRYTGYFRDITDAKYKLFGNLTVKPGTTVDTLDPSFQLNDLILANLSATGNISGAYFVGNGAGLTGISTNPTRIYNTNSEVTIPSINGNIINNVNGVTIAVVSSTGYAITGNLDVSGIGTITGNLSAGNISTAGQFSATGNVTGAGNVSGGNVITGGRVIATGNVSGGNLIATTAVSAGGNIIGGNIRTTGYVSAAGDVYGGVLNGSTLSITGDAGAGGNITAGGTISATGDITTSGALFATGNLAISYLNATGISLSGNVVSNILSTSIIQTTNYVQAGNLLSTANVSAAGNVLAGNVVANRLVQSTDLTASGVVTLSATTQTISVGESQTTGVINIGGASQTGQITIGQSTANQAANIATGAVASDRVKTINIGTNGAANSITNITVGTASGNGNVTFTANTLVRVANISGTALSVAGNIIGGNVTSGGQFSATGNVTGGNIITGGAVSATGQVSATANVVGGNIVTTGAMSAGGLISATGNITGGNINTAGIISSTGNSVHGTANVLAGNAIITTLVSATTLSASGNVNGGNLNATGLSLSGNVVSALVSAANITTSANIQGAYVLGNGSQLTGIDATSIQNGTSNVRVVSSGGNVAIGIGGTSNVAVYATTGEYITGLISASGNISGGNIIQGGTRVYKWTTATSAPSNPVPGDHWYNSSSDKLYLYINDGTGNQWVDQSYPTTLSSLAINNNLTVTGSVTASSFNFTSGNLSVSNLLNSGANGVGNIGNATTTFNTVFAKATTAQYADLAENYLADAVYEPGTVVVFGGDKEITVSNIDHDPRIAGVVSTDPAYLMNSGQNNGTPVALAGRVPCRVQGPVSKGDRLVNVAPGIAGKFDPAKAELGCVVGKSLADLLDDQVATIEIAVGRT
jgi:filamentous hemagglutinin